MPLVLRWSRRVLTLVVLVALLVAVVTAARVWEAGRHDDRAHSDAIVVLGASQFDGRPSPVLEARLEHARELFRAGVAPVVVTVGGGRPGDRFTEAQSGARYLQEHGVGTVLAVDAGSNTLQSLQAVRRLFQERGWTTATLVTDPWHSLRSRAMAADLGLTALTSPARSGPAVQTRGTQVRYIGRETAAYLYYEVFGATPEAGPAAV